MVANARARLWWSFVVIIAGFVISTGVSMFEMSSSQAQIRVITRHRLSNMEVISRLLRDLNRERLLVDAHIFEKHKGTMDAVERELDDIQADISSALRAYAPIDVAVASAWQQLATEIAALQPQIANAISLSRKNLGPEALSMMNDIGAQFENVDRTAGSLIHLNHTRADEDVERIRALQRDAVIFLALLMAVWTTFALLTTRWVTRVIAEREEGMMQATTRLEERNRELDAFAGRVAHDLRGPLTAINLAANAMDKKTAEATARAVLRRGVVQMGAIIEDLLRLSRVGAEVTGAVCQTTDVAALVREELAPKVEAVGGSLRIEAAAATVSCSAGLLRQALWNLGDNAVKYRRPESPLRVDIHGYAAQHFYEFSVSDNGTGMSPEETRHVFEPFFRGEKVQSMSGTGLGLSIVKRVIDASGGSISVDSVLGQGTTFKVRLPLVVSKAA